MYSGYVGIETVPVDNLKLKDGYEILDVFQSEIIEYINEEQMFQDEKEGLKRVVIKKPCCLSKPFAIIGKKQLTVAK